MDMDMSSSTTGPLAGQEMGKWFWSVVGAMMGICVILNIADRIIHLQRLRQSKKEWATIAKPRNVWTRLYATITAIGREIASYHIMIKIYKQYNLILPSTGRSLFIFGYFSLLLGLFFYDANTIPWENWETAGYRAAGITMSQIPLLFALSGKVNIIGFLINSSQEQLNVYHRWVARCILFTSTLHMGFFMHLWGKWDYILQQLSLSMYRYGLAAWCVLGWIVFSSFAPIRNFSYEFFVIQHIASIVTFIVLVFLHIPKYYQFYMWISIGFWIFDVLCRIIRMGFMNIGIKDRYAILKSKSEYLEIAINTPKRKWKAGQYVYLKFPTIAFWQSHPFTIMSIPNDDEMKFLIYPRNGMTRKILKFNQLPVIIDGPYGTSRDFKQFESVILMGAGSGISYILPIARDIVESNVKIVKRIRIIWVIKTIDVYNLVEDEIEKLINMARRSKCGEEEEYGAQELDLQFDIYITCGTTNNCSDPAQQENVCMCANNDPDEILPIGQTRQCCCCSSSSGKISAKRTNQINMYRGLRPQIYVILTSELQNARGESGIATCGPKSFTLAISNWVSFISDERAVHKGTGAQGIYLHCENFSL